MRLTYGWQCGVCDASGSGERSDREAVRHQTATGHSTRSFGVPESATMPADGATTGHTPPNAPPRDTLATPRKRTAVRGSQGLGEPEVNA